MFNHSVHNLLCNSTDDVNKRNRIGSRVGSETCAVHACRLSRKLIWKWSVLFIRTSLEHICSADALKPFSVFFIFFQLFWAHHQHVSGFIYKRVVLGSRATSVVPEGQAQPQPGDCFPNTHAFHFYTHICHCMCMLASPIVSLSVSIRTLQCSWEMINSPKNTDMHTHTHRGIYSR